MAISRSLPVGDQSRFIVNSLVSTRDQIYTDVDLSLAVKPGVKLLDSDGQEIGQRFGDVYKKQDAAAVTQSLKTLLLTNKYDKPFQPSFGANLEQFLFDTISEFTTKGDVAELIRLKIKKYEPRALIRNIDVDLGPYNSTNSEINAITITVVFSVGSTEQLYTFTTTLNRLR